jgi:hypothetical protein
MYKTNLFEQTVGNWTNRGVLFAYDQSIGYDFEALSQRIAAQLPAAMPKDFIGRTYSTDPIEQTNNQIALLNSMSSGKYLINYSGHGTTAGWTSSSRFFSMTNVQIQQPTAPPPQPVLRNADNFSIFMMLTCLNGYFIRNNNDSLSERLLKGKWYEEIMPPTNPPTYNEREIGAAAVWTSSGQTTPDVQELMATRFLNQVTAGKMPRFGDLIKDAKTAIVGGRDVRLSWVLLGDPSMKVR